MSTIDAAIDLGLADKTGSLTPGKRADIILVKTGTPNMRQIGDAYDALVQQAQPSDIDTVVADGRILMRKREFTALDYEKVAADANSAFRGAQGPRQVQLIEQANAKKAPRRSGREPIPALTYLFTWLFDVYCLQFIAFRAEPKSIRLAGSTSPQHARAASGER